MNLLVAAELPTTEPKSPPPGPATAVDIVSPGMVLTPWGDSSQLRDKALPPGRRTTPSEAEQNHRERLFGAMVANVAEHGYEATTIDDLVELSGVSRSAFYKHFSDKRQCFLAA